MENDFDWVKDLSILCVDCGAFIVWAFINLEDVFILLSQFFTNK